MAARPGPRASGPGALFETRAAALGRIAGDRRRGASALANAAILALERAFAARPGATYSRAALAGLGSAVAAAQPAMGPFRRWSAELVRRSRGRAAERSAGALRRWAGRERRRLAGETSRAVRTALCTFPPTQRVVTLSQSETVRRLLTGLPPARRPAEVSVLRSRPGGEGAAQAAALRRAGVNARVIEDREGAEAVAEADLVLLGADAIYRDGTLIHKVGTRPLAEAARRLHVPVAVVAGASKFVDAPPPRTAPAGAFDRTPGALLSVIWTDAGPVRPPQSRRRPGPRRSSTGAARAPGRRRRA